MDCFVYGTLTDPGRVGELLDDWTFGPDVVLRGAHRVEGAYPTLAPGGETTGRILRTDEVAALDRYEGVDRGLYVRVSVPWGDDGGGESSETVQVYVGDPSKLGVTAPVTWPGEGTFEERVVSAIRGSCAVVERDG
ncbi:gamma-glutamylcyclotransferase family protein [Haloarchaeobius sp. DT45]|uniref:gamma-glutamylcyclotransferase family protein n=1 Tax=Haloarchaeobius sp. DT45 TaxID=3446116 RepID=UPI003F6AD668